ncbi:unnamed protein product, partial [marine sediment metagenome]
MIDQRVSEQTKRIVKEKSKRIADVIEDKNKKPLMESSYRISEVLSEIERSCIDYIWHLKDFFNKSYNLNIKIQENHSLQSMKLKELKAILEEEIYHGKDELTRLGIEFLKVKPFLNITESKIEKMVIQK